MKKLYASKTFLKMAGGRMHTPHPTSLYPPPAISYRNDQKSLVYFSHLAPLILFFLLKGRVKRGGYGSMPPIKYSTAWTHAIFLLTLSCEKNNASRPDGEDFSFSMCRYDKFSVSR